MSAQTGEALLAQPRTVTDESLRERRGLGVCHLLDGSRCRAGGGAGRQDIERQDQLRGAARPQSPPGLPATRAAAGARTAAEILVAVAAAARARGAHRAV